jgi:hypothetical protein
MDPGHDSGGDECERVAARRSRTADQIILFYITVIVTPEDLLAADIYGHDVGSSLILTGPAPDS